MSDSDVSEETSDYSETDYGSGSSSDDEGQPNGAAEPSMQAPAPRRHAVPGLALNPQRGEGGAPPAPSGGPQRQGVPRLGVPSLGLRQMDSSAAEAPSTSRGRAPAIPALQLGGRPAQQREPESLQPASARSHNQPRQRPGAPTSRLQLGTVAEGGQVAVQLVSFAFALGQATGPNAGQGAGSTEAAVSLAAVRERCVKALGISSEELRFFELRELPQGIEAVPSGSAGLGVAVNKSGERTALGESART